MQLSREDTQTVKRNCRSNLSALLCTAALLVCASQGRATPPVGDFHLAMGGADSIHDLASPIMRTDNDCGLVDQMGDVCVDLTLDLAFAVDARGRLSGDGSLTLAKTAGDFDQTLIVMMGEFGRTPGELNLQGGRDHHRDAMSVAMMGGGIAGNRVIGVTDRRGAFVTDPGWSGNRTIRTEDIAATVYSALGIDWTKSIQDTPSGRKFEYVPFGLSGRYTSVDEAFR